VVPEAVVEDQEGCLHCRCQKGWMAALAGLKDRLRQRGWVAALADLADRLRPLEERHAGHGCPGTQEAAGQCV
jgi:hypothetical protein